MIVILDIDQDFFFYPNFEGTLEEAKKQNHKNLKQTLTPNDVIQRYEIKEKPYKIFENHNEVCFDILSKGYGKKEVKLIHLDAHSDIHTTKDNKLVEIQYFEINLSNWINYLISIGIIQSVDFVYQNVKTQNFIYKSEKGFEITWHECSFDNHSWNGKIDCVYYTLSNEWAPKNDLVKQFTSILK